MHESCSTCRAEFVCSVHGNNPPECVTKPEGSLLSWSPWTNEEVATISDQVYRLCNYSNRLRISQLRRMGDAAILVERSAEEALRLEQHRRHRQWPHRDVGKLHRRYMRLVRFIAKVDDEIARLRGEG